MSKRYLRDYKDVRRYLAEIADRLENGKIDIKTASALREICNAIVYSLKEENFGKKVEEIERNNKLMEELISKMGGISRSELR